MNYKQKLGYMVLGAGILALGIIIGQVVTPDIEAQSNGVFDKITCRELQVVDEKGRQTISISSANGTALVTLFDTHSGVPGVMLGSSKEMNYVHVTDKRSAGVPGISLYCDNGVNGAIVTNTGSAVEAIILGSNDTQNYVSVINKLGQQGIILSNLNFGGSTVTVYDNQEREAISLSSTGAHNSLNIFNKKLGIPGINFLTGEGANGVAILDPQGEIAISLASNDQKNRVVVIDKTGKEMSLGD